MTKRSLAVAMSLAAMLGGCRGTDAAEPKQPVAATQPTQPTGSSSPAEVEIKDLAEYEARSVRLVTGFAAAFEAGGTDCDKVAASVGSFVAEHGAEFQAVMAYDAQHPEAEATLMASHPEMQQQFEAKVLPLLQACLDHEGFRNAILPITRIKKDEAPPPAAP